MDVGESTRDTAAVVGELGTTFCSCSAVCIGNTDAGIFVPEWLLGCWRDGDDVKAAQDTTVALKPSLSIVEQISYTDTYLKARGRIKMDSREKRLSINAGRNEQEICFQASNVSASNGSTVKIW